jgi:hypothetical protein
MPNGVRLLNLLNIVHLQDYVLFKNTEKEVFMAITQGNYLPVINGFVIMPDREFSPDNRLPLANALSAVPGSTVKRINNHKSELHYLLPSDDLPNGYTQDYYQVLRNASLEWYATTM